jgi:hypothetical protein
MSVWLIEPETRTAATRATAIRALNLRVHASTLDDAEPGARDFGIA